MPRVGTKRYRGFTSIAHYEASLHLQDSEDSGKSDPLQLPSRSTFEATPAKRRRMSAMHRLSDSDQDLLLDVKSQNMHRLSDSDQDLLDGDMSGLDVQLETWTPYVKYDLDQKLAAAVPTPASTPSGLGPLSDVSPTRHIDPICFGFFSPGKSPATRQEIVSFPQCLAVMSPSLSSLRLSRAEHKIALMFEDKAELQELLNDALDTGCAVLTAQSCPNI